MLSQRLKVDEGLILTDTETGKSLRLYIGEVRGTLDNRNVQILIDSPKSDYLASRIARPRNNPAP